MRKYLLIILSIFPIIFLPFEICYIFKIHQEFKIKEEDLFIIQEVLDMEPKLREFIDIIKSKEEHLSDYEELVSYAFNSYEIILSILPLKEVRDSGLISSVFFTNFHDYYLSTTALISSTTQLFDTVPSPTEYYDSFIEFYRFDSHGNLSDTFHIFITNFHENLRLLLAKGEELYA